MEHDDAADVSTPFRPPTPGLAGEVPPGLPEEPPLARDEKSDASVAELTPIPSPVTSL